MARKDSGVDFFQVFRDNPQTETKRIDYIIRIAALIGRTTSYVKDKFLEYKRSPYYGAPYPEPGQVVEIPAPADAAVKITFLSEESDIKPADMSEMPPESDIDPAEKIRLDIANRRDNARVKELEKDVRMLQDQYANLMEKYDIALALREHRPEVHIPEVPVAGARNEAIPIIQFSDWHVEKRIDRRVMNGLNEFNLDICAERVKNTYVNTVRLVRKERQDVDIDTLIINLGGDFINNYLHEHDVQENYLSPIEALFFAKERIKESLIYIATNAGVSKIVLLCCNGNHPRLTKRMQSDNDYKMNLEAVLYHTLKQELTDSIFEWHIPESELGYLRIGGRVIRYFHGHQFNYMGGVGGLTIPLNKTTMRYDQVNKADFNLISHWHTFDLIGGKSSINGSLCGYDPYAQKLGCTFDVPKQSFQILDLKRGFTGRFPILCDE